MSIKGGVAALLALILLGGCAGSAAVDKRVSFIDPVLVTKMEGIHALTRVNDGGLLEVQVKGISKSSSYNRLEYRIEWLDADGFTVATGKKGWTKFPAFNNTEFSFQSVAPEASVRDFKILIRKVR